MMFCGIYKIVNLKDAHINTESIAEIDDSKMEVDEDDSDIPFEVN